MAWNIVILGALAVFAGQFASLPAQSAAFPRLITYPVGALTAASLVVELLRYVRRRPASADGPQAPGPRASRPISASPAVVFAPRTDGGSALRPVRWVQLLLGVALGVVYLLLWAPLGFELDTAVFLVATPLLLGQPRRRFPTLLLIAVVTAVLFTFLFHLGAGAILPAGVFGLRWP